MTVSRHERKEWAREHLRGLENVTMPSFTPDLSKLDEEGIRWDVRFAKSMGYFSTMCACETGMSTEEIKHFLSIVADEAGDDLLVSLTLLFDSFEQTSEVLQHAQAVGCDFALLGYPHTFRPAHPDEIYRRTAELAEATDLGLIMYATDKFDFGRFHPSQIPFGAYDRIADLPNVIGMKVGFGDLAATYEALHRYNDRLLVNVGTPRLVGLFPLLHRRFGVQWFGGGSWEMWQSPDKPYLMEYFDLVVRGEVEQAKKAYWQLAPVNAAAMASGLGRGGDSGMYHWPFGKYVSWSVGGNGGLTRQPAMRLTNHHMQMRKSMLRAIGIEPREPDEEFLVGRVQYEQGQRPFTVS